MLRRETNPRDGVNQRVVGGWRLAEQSGGRRTEGGWVEVVPLRCRHYTDGDPLSLRIHPSTTQLIAEG